MKKGFTIIEVSILFVIFLIVAFLVAPLSLDDTRQAKFASRWRDVQQDFTNIFYSTSTQKEESNIDFATAINSIIDGETKEEIPSYKITYLNGTYPSNAHRFDNYKLTYSNATIALKLFPDKQDNKLGLIMYDVNGKTGPNSWGKDVFGLSIYEDKFEPFCKSDSIKVQKQDCSKNNTGLCCSNYYLIGGKFD